MERTVDAAETSGKRRKYFWPVVAKVVIDVVIPTAGYYTLRGMGVEQIIALCLTSVPVVVYFLYRKSRGQKVDAFEVSCWRSSRCPTARR